MHLRERPNLDDDGNDDGNGNDDDNDNERKALILIRHGKFVNDETPGGDIACTAVALQSILKQQGSSCLLSKPKAQAPALDGTKGLSES